jgi:hypothetical protein
MSTRIGVILVHSDFAEGARPEIYTIRAFNQLDDCLISSYNLPCIDIFFVFGSVSRDVKYGRDASANANCDYLVPQVSKLVGWRVE